VQAVSRTAQRIAHLKSLHERWKAELEQTVATNPEVAFHSAEALQDLEGLIRTLESQAAKDARPE
jgi:hypothetical protein